MGCFQKAVVLAFLYLAACNSSYAAGVGQKSSKESSLVQQAGARRLTVQRDGNATGEIEKEAKKAKKGSNVDMLGEQQVPKFVLDEVHVLLEGEGDSEGGEMFECRRQSPLTDICTLRGDVRIRVSSGEVVLYAKDRATPRGVLAARPHPRKWDYNIMKDISELRMRSVDAERGVKMQCTSHRSVPAVILSVGGYSGGAFHDLNQVFLPLFQTVHRFERDVVLLLTDLKGAWWWKGADPQETILGAMTKHPIHLIGQATDTTGQNQGVQCFDQVIVGLSHNLCMYDEFGGVETRSEVLAGVRLSDFGAFVARGLRIPPPVYPRVTVLEGSTPTVGVLQRGGARVLLNFEQMLKAAERSEYTVVPILLDELSPRELVEKMQQIDVLVGVHGAGLANIALMRPGGVVMQIMPYGEWGKGRLVGREFRNLADFQGAKYLEWHVPLQDTSLIEQYSLTDPILMDPDSVWREQHIVQAMNLYHNQNVSMPEDMFGAYLRHIKKDLHFKEQLLMESSSEGGISI